MNERTWPGAASARERLSVRGPALSLGTNCSSPGTGVADYRFAMAKAAVSEAPDETIEFRRGCRTNPQAGALGRSKGGVQKAETRCSCVAPAARRRRFQRRQRPSQRVQPRSLQTALCNSLRPLRSCRRAHAGRLLLGECDSALRRAHGLIGTITMSPMRSHVGCRRLDGSDRPL